MEEPGKSAEAKPKRKLAIYRTLGIVFLFLLALTSSLDSSFIFIFLGLSLAMFSVVFLDWMKARSTGTDYGRSQYDTRSSYSSASDGSQQHRKQQSGAKPIPNDPDVQGKKVILAILAIFAAVIALPLVVSVLSSGNYEPDATYYYQTGDQYFYSSQYDSALINFRKAIQLDPDYVEPVKGSGKVFIQTEQYDSALVMFDRALAIAPDDKEAMYNRGLSYFGQKNFEQTVQIAESILKEDPEYYDAMLLAGDGYYDLGQHGTALSWYQKAYDSGVKSTNLCWRIAYLHDEKGNTAEAIALYKETLSYDSSVVEIYTRLGELITDSEGNFFRTRAAQLKTN